MRYIRLCFFLFLCGLGLLFAQDKQLFQERSLDFHLPSQELFKEAFKQSAPAVVWSDWSLYPFSKAIALNQPILLDICVEWDKSCYKMDTEIFSNPEVAYLLNNLFISIRVDGDKRPDIRDAYQAKIWPSIFFLLPNGEPIIWEKKEGENVPIALGYVRPDTIKTIGWRVFNYFKGERKKVLKLSSHHMALEEKKLTWKPGLFNEEIIDQTASALKGNFDLQYGGFGKEPKFPIPSAIEFALLLHTIHSNPPLFEIASKTLKAIMLSDLNDKIDGGLFRMAMKADWSEPTHEKLLNKNAMVLSNLIDIYRISGLDHFKKEALSLIQYMNNNLLSEKGGFYAGQLSDFGLWEGYYEAGEKERALLPKPGLYKTFFCDANSIVASSYIKASFVFKDPSLLLIAERTIDFILKNLYSPGRGVFHYYEDGKAELIGILKDQSLFCLALLDLYQATGKEIYLLRAKDIAQFMIDNLEDIVEGGFFNFLRNNKAPGKLKLPIKSLENNSLAARAMIRLYYHTGLPQYLRKARRTLQLFSESYIPYEVFAAPYALACVEFFNEPLKVLIVGRKGDPKVGELISSGNRISELWKIVMFIDMEKQDVTQMAIDPDIVPALYLIKASLMSPPITKSSRVISGYRRFKKTLRSREAR